MEFIFLTYINRSGSTYLAQILSSSEEILACPEANILVEKFLETPENNFIMTDPSGNQLLQELNIDLKFKNWGLSQEDICSLSNASNNFDAFCSLLTIYRNRIKPNASKILFKAERIIYLWDRIKSDYHGDNLLHLIAVVRDPRGIYASQRNTIWPGSDRPFSQNPVHTSILWNRYINEVQRLTKFHSDITLIKYEDLLKNPEDSLENLAGKIRLNKISFSPENGDFYSRIPGDQRKIHRNIKSPPIREKENEWKQILNRYEIDLVQRMTGKYNNKFGYIQEIREVSSFKLLKTIIPQTISYYFNYYTEKLLFRINKMFHGKGSI